MMEESRLPEVESSTVVNGEDSPRRRSTSIRSMYEIEAVVSSHLLCSIGTLINDVQDRVVSFSIDVSR